MASAASCEREGACGRALALLHLPLAFELFPDWSHLLDAFSDHRATSLLTMTETLVTEAESATAEADLATPLHVPLAGNEARLAVLALGVTTRGRHLAEPHTIVGSASSACRCAELAVSNHWRNLPCL
jgi:hypothetical protein